MKISIMKYDWIYIYKQLYSLNIELFSWIRVGATERPYESK